MLFFVLKHPKRPVDDALTDFLPAVGSKRGDAPRCPTCGNVVGMMPELPPVRVELETWGRRFGDLAFGVSNEVLVSERFKDAFILSGLTGFSRFTPVEIVKITARREKIPEQVPNYFITMPGGSRAAVDDRASDIDYERRWTCQECRIGYMKRLRRLVLESNTWSGEDVFIPRGLPGTIVTSERFKAFCDRHAFTNCLLVEADRHHFDHFPWENAPDANGSGRERK